MRKIDTDEKMYSIARDILAEKGIHGPFVITNEYTERTSADGKYTVQTKYNGQALVFTDPKDDFLYKLAGGDRVIKRLIDMRWTEWMEGVLTNELAEQIKAEIDKEVLNELLKGCTK